ncbi:phosphomannomutase/phosphoglucomutase [Mycobacterium intermedium]|uniref:Phosphomannomutase/phosphoglucomutase n=1 Tax=Mycobacterium intermedium TaxID=28445 RepID=A0A1E3SHI8_MYCIE|nr:phosphomannomutase/phosphoglucomutase [Mycobacterium intermedium]MCV6963642.1 phosphomannomutase/phosphoglucomutase [Mycobacterium intermedium]ODR01018.1 phosphomannomutase/phosphoglucomutase [Mycobacterium intermedium]OPE52467.1 phosphomannomutase/phosphoglucomutase [Mycobacterium intermedium]ORB10431.1 phosphomannomutase/phosphoglucomutase [Mycobacterium intermedium]
MPWPAEAVHRVIKAYDVRGLVGEEITDEFVADVGAAFARLMRAEGAAQVVIGHDMRDSSPSLAAAFATGVTGQGLDVVRIGLASTDQLYFASGLLNCPGAMFTASHNPAAYNGIKLCRAAALPVGADTGLNAIRNDLIGDPAGPAGQHAYDGPPGTISDRDVLSDYGAFLRSLVDTSELRPLRVAVDAGNGMAGHTAPAVLGAIDSITLLPLYFELDGSFPNHEANPLDPANLRDLQAFVQQTGADIGLAFDGDADRCFVVDERGLPVSPSAVTALVAARELGREIGATVIHNVITSRAVPELVLERGGTPLRSRVGHSYIKAMMAETGAIFGGEHSAHYYFRDFFGADSGMLAALYVLAALGEQDNRPLSELASDYQRYESSGEINFTVADADAAVDGVLKSFGGRIQSIDHLDGVTVDLGDDSWFNLRSSNTEPLLRLNVEGRSAEDVDAVVSQVSAQIAAVTAGKAGEKAESKT